MAGKHGLDMMLSEYYNSPNLRSYIKCFLDEAEEVREAMTASIKYRYLADSFGVMVDDIAYLVGASRTIYGAAALGFFGFYKNAGAMPAGDDRDPSLGGILRSDSDKESGDFVRTDSQLKDAIRARIIKIMGSCTCEQIIAYVDLVIGRSLDLELTEGNQTLDYTVHGKLSIAERVLMAYMLPDFKPVGVRQTLKDDTGIIALVANSNIYPPESV